jgi:ribose transport system ATP-binding protein
VLEVRRGVKAFGATRALDGVDLAVRAGEIHALLGENGAGKSTLIKVLAGVHDLDSGEVLLDGDIVDPIHDELPISFIHQDLGLVATMSVAENVAMVTGYPRLAGRLISWRAARRQAEAVLRRMGADIDPRAEVATLSAADHAIVAIARALAVDCRVLVLDEPSASLPAADVSRLFEAVQAMRREGVAVIYVTHRLDEVFGLADRVTVLRNGRTVSTGPIATYDEDRVIADIVGRSLSQIFVRGEAGVGDAVLAVKGLRGFEVGPVDFEVRRREMVGLVGLRGSGHDTISRMVVGDERVEGGTVELNGAELPRGSVRRALDEGLGFVPGKRDEESVAGELSVRENLYPNLALTGRGLRPGLPRTERRAARGAVGRYDIRTAGTEVPITTLSGGNQQKVILARWLELRRPLLVLEEPTSGVDIGAKSEIYRLIAEMLDDGGAGLLVSSDFEEVAGICHRALVVNRGRLVAELTGEDLNVDTLTAAAVGSAAGREETR